MSALGNKVLDLAEQQGLLDGKAIAELRKQVAESKFVVTPEAIAKVLVDHGHLTPFQARKLVRQAQGNDPDPVEQRVAEKAQQRKKGEPEEDLTFADEAPTRRPRSPAGKSPDKPSLERPVEGSTAEDFVELEPVDVSRPPRGNRWKTDAPDSAISETIEMKPADLAAPPPGPGDLVPIDDLFGDQTPVTRVTPAQTPAAQRPAGVRPSVSKPLPAPLTPLATPPRPVRPPAKNVWDSPLLLVGGGALGIVVVAFGLLFYALTRGSAAEMFAQGEEAYRSGSYTSAIAIYDKFLRKYADDPNASLARVRRGMASLRQVTDDVKNPRLGLEAAQQLLPQIENEEQFREARAELATILPDIADALATQAGEADERSRREQLVKLAGDALAMVNNPSYLPASLRRDRESQVARIVDKLKVAERSIQQDKDLAAAVEQITAASEKGDAATAYQTQAELLKSYPALAAAAELVAAVRQVGEKERQLVSVAQEGPSPLTGDHEPQSERVVISYQDGAAVTAGNARAVFVLAAGGVYGIDAASGKLLWRRFVGYETTHHPLAVKAEAGADVLVIDGRRQEVARLKGASGELVWRHALNDRPVGAMVAGDRVLITTRTGKLLAVDAVSGKFIAAAQLPQRATVGPAVRPARVVQLGEHSTLFVLDAQSLACAETVYLGHKAGTILVPPVAVLDQVLVIESPADDFSQIQVLRDDPQTKKLVLAGKPLRLKGRVVTPLAVSGNRVAAITDLGQLAVYEVDAGAPQQPLRFVAGLEASEHTPRTMFCELERNSLWMANRRRMLLEVQASLAQLTRRWTENQDDTFIAPLQISGDVLVQIRRRSGVSAVMIEGSNKASGASLWTAHIASPIAALVPAAKRKGVDVLTAQGRLYSLAGESFAGGQSAEPRFSPSSAGTAIFPETSLSGDGQTLVWTESKSNGQIYVYDVPSGNKPAAVSLPSRAVGPAIGFLGGALTPLADGSVALVPREAGTASVAPFLPPLVPDALPKWTRPAALADEKTFLISDGRQTVYAVTNNDSPRPHLTAVGESILSAPVASPLVAAGSIGVGVIRQEGIDAIGGFDARGQPAFEPLPLQGRVVAGPFAVGGLVLVVAEPDGLVCIGSDGKPRWQQPLDHGPLAGAVIATSDGDLVAAFQSGVVSRLDAASGKELASHDVGESLQGPVCIFEEHIYLSGSDGVVHRIAVPRRP